jgi:hypothetical protein
MRPASVVRDRLLDSPRDRLSTGQAAPDDLREKSRPIGLAGCICHFADGDVASSSERRMSLGNA